MTKWATPEPSEVALAVTSFTDDNLKRLFFSQLKNPAWIGPLAQLGVFAPEPGDWTDESGMRRARPWPEGEYLARMAAQEPSTVTEILVGHRDSTNPWVHRVVLDAAASVPPAEAARLVPQIVKALRSGIGWVDAPKLIFIAAGLAGSDTSSMSKLLTGALEPKAGPKETDVFGSRIPVHTWIDGYWYVELAPRIVELLEGMGAGGLRLAMGWLSKAISITAGNQRRMGSLWRPSIAPSSQNLGSHEVTDALVDLVRDVAALLAARQGAAAVVEILGSGDDLLFDRIAAEVAARALATDAAPNDIQRSLALLLDPALLDTSARPEYVHLAQALLPRLNDDQLGQWRDRINDEPRWQGNDELMGRIASRGEVPAREVPADDVADVRRRLRYRLLLPLRNVLPADLAAEVGAMAGEFGEIEHPEFSSYTTSFTGPVSPMSHEDLSALTSEELASFLRDWTPPDDFHFGPSIEGLARELELVAAAHPELVADIADELPGLGRSYVRAALTGWAKAMPDGYRPSPAVWGLAIKIAKLPDDGDPPNVELSADDPVWRWAQRQAVDFAVGYLTAIGDELTADDAKRVWGILAPLTDHPDPTPGHEDRFGGDNMDPLTLSLNTVRPPAIRAAIKLLRELVRLDLNSDSEIQQPIWDQLSRHLSAEQDPSLAVVAVYGEALGHFWHLNRDWFAERSSEMFAVLSSHDEARRRADVIVSIALRTYRTNEAFVDFMRPALRDVLSPRYNELTHIDGWRGSRNAQQSAATHVLDAIVMGIIAADDELAISLFSANPEVVGDALGTLGWSLMRALDKEEGGGPVPPEVLERARALVDSRAVLVRDGATSAKELAGIYWWIRSKAFPPSWWLPLLLLASTDPEFNPRGMIGEELADAARVEPALTMEALAQLLPANAGWERYDLIQNAPRILATALESDDETARQAAEQMLDQMFRSGHVSIVSDVDELRGNPGGGTDSDRAPG